MGEVADVRQALPCVTRLSPHVVIIDAQDEAPSFQCSVEQLITGGPDGRPRVLALVQSLERCAPLWQAAGAKGVLDSQASPERIIAAVRMIAAGYRLVIPTAGAAAPAATTPAVPAQAPRPEIPDVDLVASGITRRERDVLQLIIRGYSNAEISEALFLSESTVKSHVQRMLDKLALRNRVHAVIYAYEKGIVRAGGNTESFAGTTA
ncbi:helix-turn-helix transcriptional regulator [Actinacidiphila alni]|uniref:helix-turn-helix transcriptional regulator n=1 Tax=Actinacidiphila alni TaxID=380248 RepID=UPI003455C9EB